MKTVQFFSQEYLRQCRYMKPEHIIQFLEDFRTLQATVRPAKSRLISLKVPEPLLAAFKMKAISKGIAYQTQIKRLMQEWLYGQSSY
jgi:predicted DNA binding CopG/RHH family protein